MYVNDWNVLRRYGGDSGGALAAAVDTNAGVMNADVLYMHAPPLRRPDGGDGADD